MVGRKGPRGLRSILLAASTAASARDAYYARIAPSHLAPLWMRLKSLVPAHPAPDAIAHRWAWDEVRPYLMESARAAISTRRPGKPVIGTPLDSHDMIVSPQSSNGNGYLNGHGNGQAGNGQAIPGGALASPAERGVVTAQRQRATRR